MKKKCQKVANRVKQTNKIIIQNCKDGKIIELDNNYSIIFEK